MAWWQPLQTEHYLKMRSSWLEMDPNSLTDVLTSQSKRGHVETVAQVHREMPKMGTMHWNHRTSRIPGVSGNERRSMTWLFLQSLRKKPPWLKPCVSTSRLQNCGSTWSYHGGNFCGSPGKPSWVWVELLTCMVRTKSQASRDLENPRGPPEFQLLQETEMLVPILVVRSMLGRPFSLQFISPSEF